MLASFSLVTSATTAPLVGLTTVSAQAPKEDFQFPTTLYMVGAKLDCWAALQVPSVGTGAVPSSYFTSHQ